MEDITCLSPERIKGIALELRRQAENMENSAKVIQKIMKDPFCSFCEQVNNYQFEIEPSVLKAIEFLRIFSVELEIAVNDIRIPDEPNPDSIKLLSL